MAGCATWRRDAPVATARERGLRGKRRLAKDCSTGEQKALLVSLILANARTEQDFGAPPILLLDEVAAHLDPTAVPHFMTRSRPCAQPG